MEIVVYCNSSKHTINFDPLQHGINSTTSKFKLLTDTQLIFVHQEHSHFFTYIEKVFYLIPNPDLITLNRNFFEYTGKHTQSILIHSRTTHEIM